ncbi:MAG: methyltransferase [Bacteroidales bacterium]|jgi:tRNA1Val (adenine37-N6)-methyltransferase|nr:methyltransferase [Bacteroidales bacterium]
MLFRFKNFSLEHEHSALKIGTDALLLATLVDLEAQQQILDIGSGCGILTYVLADRLRNTCYPQTFRGIEIDFSSFQESNENRALYHEPAHQDISFVCTSVQEFQSEVLCDLIVSNPPYFHDDLKPAESKRRISKHQDGLLSFEDLASHVKRLLRETGTFWLILPQKEYTQFTHIAAATGLFPYKEIQIQPTPKKAVNRIVGAFKTTASSHIACSKLTIRTESGKYSEPYLELMRLVCDAQYLTNSRF